MEVRASPIAVREDGALIRDLALAGALHRVAEVVLTLEEPEQILSELAAILGEALEADRSLIYDVSFEKQRASALCEWLNPAVPGVTATKADYPLAYFLTAAREMARSRRWLESHLDGVHPALEVDGAGALLHGQMSIRSLLWFPFAFRPGGYYLLVLNQVNARRVWTPAELAFLDAAARHVSLALMKIALIAEHRRTEERFRALIEKAADVILTVDARGTITFASPAIRESSGFDPEEVVGKSLLEEAHPDDEDQLLEALQQVQAPGATARVTARRRRKDGSWRVAESVIRNLIHVPAVGALVVNERDITEQRRMEVQLRQAQKLDTIGRLAGGVAHDFNNLLVGILGYSESLADELGPAHAGWGDLQEIRKAGDRARELTSQLLAVGRQQVTAPRRVDLNEVLRDGEKLLRRMVGEAVELRLFPGEGLGPVFADPSQLQQVVMNLAVNARDAMPHGGQLTIETSAATLDEAFAASRTEVEPGRYVLLAVTDSGEGMAPEVLAHLFEPFFTTKAPGRGTGLGLATVHGIVRQAGGHVWAYSEPGLGTTFKVYLPVSAGVPESRPPPPVRAVRGGSECLLFVEDDATTRGLAVRALRRAGYEVLVAENGREALAVAAVAARPAALLVTDVVMPEMGGRELAETLRAGRPELRVLYLSGYTSRGVLDGGVDLLSKPFTPSQLLARVRDALDVSASR